MKRGERETMEVRRNKRACVDCTKRCTRIHGRSNFASGTDSSSSFFKVMLGDFTQSLYVPPSFAKTIADLIDTSIFIEDSVGTRWRIRVCKKKKSLAFGTGWCNFVLDHSISLGEFLVFKQTEKSVFSVQIFSTSGSERVHFCEAKKKSKSNPNKRKRERISKSPRSKTLAAGNKKLKDHTPSIQEATRKEEQKERRTRSALRRLLMEDLEDKDLLVKKEIPFVPPISAVPSEGKCLAITDCSDKGCEETMRIICVGTEGEKIEGNIDISDNEKGKNVEGEINIEQVNFSCENVSSRNAASESKMGDDLMAVKTETAEFDEVSELNHESMTHSAK